MAADYDPFAPGDFAAGVRTVEIPDPARGGALTCESWYPSPEGEPAAERRDAAAVAGTRPLVVYSHHSGGERRAATFLARHLASHGYVVAATDHVPPAWASDGDTPESHAARTAAIIAARVPDVRRVLDALLAGDAGPAAGGGALPAGVDLDHDRIGLVGHSFGGWTVLATPDVDSRVRSVVAHAPGGSHRRRPGILPLDLAFAWGREVPTLILAAAADVCTPPEDVADVYDRVPGPKLMVTLDRADHQHFVDDVAVAHEALRTMSLPGEAAWIPAAMRPISELCPEAEAHLFVRGLTLAHLDATLRGHPGARDLLAGDVDAVLRTRGISAATTAGPASGVPAR